MQTGKLEFLISEEKCLFFCSNLFCAPLATEPMDNSRWWTPHSPSLPQMKESPSRQPRYQKERNAKVGGATSHVEGTQSFWRIGSRDKMKETRSIEPWRPNGQLPSYKVILL